MLRGCRLQEPGAAADDASGTDESMSSEDERGAVLAAGAGADADITGPAGDVGRLHVPQVSTYRFERNRNSALRFSNPCFGGNAVHYSG